ncbi:MAG: ABC transporter ATP-binding protein [Thermoanaerobaculia bacterium]|nr:ABC transporter ATP-binding protein [Thermoanaerobaculia bacterium]MCZ7651825.1 ABC transporter ATP-binding protein [Thermoanaerobaculia bacterium]
MTVVRLERVSLRYRLATQSVPSIKEFAIHLLRGSLSYRELWALRDVSFEVRRGESVAIVGRNGAGKSTLLKVVSRILQPTEGRCTTAGSVAPILELGAGFDTELTGRENILLNALLLGHRRRAIVARMEEIVAFSELEEFIDSPLRNYSSGMRARLGFAIATAWRPELLVLDEVFAVGDEAFAAKCRARMAELRREGTTLLLVSHQPSLVRAICQRCLWLDRGQLRADGPAAEVLATYQRFSRA